MKLKTHRISSVLIGLSALFLTAQAGSAASGKPSKAVGQFPAIQAENLNEKVFNLPKDFPADRNLLLLGFKREQADTLDTWVEGLQLKKKNISWFEIPVISSAYSIGSFFIDGAMRRGTPSEKTRDHIVTLYTDQKAFAASMGLNPQMLGAYIVVVDRQGNNLGFVEGAFSKSKASKIKGLLKLK